MNIIQLQDQLKGMPTEVIIQNLQNPTGAVPTYLLAGELGRRQKMEAEAAAQMPGNTVTEQLVQESSPQQSLGQMAPQAMAPMPVPPEQSGVANLPAPNVGQNYAGGGIVSFAEGDYVRLPSETQSDLEDIAVEGLMGYFGGIPGFLMSPGTLNADETEDEAFYRRLEEANLLQDMPTETAVAEEALTDNEKAGLAGTGIVAATANQSGIKNLINKIPTKKKAVKFISNLLKSKKPKATPKAAPKKGPGRPKKQQPVAPGGGKIDDLLTSGLAAGVKYGGKGAGALYRGAKANPLTTGLVGLGGLAMYNSAQEAAAERQKQDTEDAIKAESIRQAEAQKQKEMIAANQAYLDDLQAKKDKQKQRELYLALALGGAKTMQGTSPYALQNIGAGLETGVSTMSAFDIARAEREAELAKAGADLDFEYLKMAQGAEEKYRDQLIDILDSDDYQAYKRDLQIQVDDEDISQADMDLKLENYIINRIGMPPSIRQATVGNKQFTQI